MSDRDQCIKCSFLGRNNVCEHPIPDWAGPPQIVNPDIFRDCPEFTEVRVSKDLKRLTRVLIYEGTPEKINGCLKYRGVKGSHSYEGLTIKEAIVGDFLDEAN